MESSKLTQKTLRAVVDELPRAEWLDAEMPFSDFERIEGTGRWPANASFLHHLSVKDSSLQANARLTFFRKCTAPSLRHFEAGLSFMNWIPGALPVSLTTLYVQNTRYSSEVTSVENVVDVLQCLPHLEWLTLHMVLESVSGPGTASPPHKRVALPHLHTLCLVDSAIPCVRLFQSLVFSAAQTEMVLDFGSVYSTSSMAIAPIIVGLVREISPDAIVIRDHCCRSFDCTVYNTTATFAPQSGAESHTYHVRPLLRVKGTIASFVDDYPIVSQNTPSLATNLCNTVLSCLQSVTTCSLYLTASRTDPIWDQIAQALPKVTVLYTSKFSALMASLGAVASPSSDAPQYRMAHVTQLNLLNVHFGGAGWKVNTKQLVPLLSSRKEGGCTPIDRITLDGCVNLTALDVDILRESVQDVHVVIER
ncbi:hypothetical protein EIP91_001228 [Steccherinum ochraceum]|uniref:F-box domain-containing protein n=1 Tax=Steccherinum ochraceum TaxID=92696 RepID=A0A4R0REE1_9APHY|nr:hypothetical protein EIP91_001228 [Steccherinum ochraceum]